MPGATDETKNTQASDCSSAAPKEARSFFGTIKEWSEMIKVEHTVFALPFALCGLLLGSEKVQSLATWIWTVLAFAGARAAAMTLNRLIDAGIDALNPRTNTRAIPAGKVKWMHALLFAIASFALMIFAAMHLPPLCLTL